MSSLIQEASFEQLPHHLKLRYPSLKIAQGGIKFINVSMSALGVFDKSCESLTKMLKDLDIEVPIQRRLLWKVMNIAIRSTYYIFCRRNKDWTDPDLMDF